MKTPPTTGEGEEKVRNDIEAVFIRSIGKALAFKVTPSRSSLFPRREEPTGLVSLALEKIRENLTSATVSFLPSYSHPRSLAAEKASI